MSVLKKSNRTFLLIAVVMVIALLSGALGLERAYAEKEFMVPASGYKDGYKLHIYQSETDPNQMSCIMEGYDPARTDTDVIIPVQIEYEGAKYPAIQGGMMIGAGAFKGNTNIKKVAVPKGIEAISNNAFQGCASLIEIAVGGDIDYFGNDVFADCPNLVTYRFGPNITMISSDPKIGQDSSGKVYPGVTVYTTEGSSIDEYIKKINAASKASGGNEIKLVYEADPYAGHTVKPSSSPASDDGKDGEKKDEGKNNDGSGNKEESGNKGDGGGSSTKDTETKGKDGTPCGEGASLSVAEKAILALSGEKDPKGSVFNLLQLKGTKAAKNKVTIKWKKPSGTKKFIIYGNACGKKMVKLASTGKTSKSFTKVNKKKVKKGTYYKFLVVAVDGKDKVVSTSKAVHIATPGGKIGNDKKIKSAAKKNKVQLKAKKSFKLKAKAVPASKKLKVKKHRKVSFESANTKVAKVTSKGVIKAVKKGKCEVYCYAQNGVALKIKVTVK